MYSPRPRNSFLGSIRSHTTLSASLRETAICRVAVLNKAWYEWDQHAPLLRAASGVSADDVDAVLSTPARAADAKVVDERHSAVVAYTDAMTLDVAVPEDVFVRLRQCFEEREIVEITATVAAYNCVSRFLVALDVGEKNRQEGPGVEGS
jgi:alkylhydroperoxidase family enzyme